MRFIVSWFGLYGSVGHNNFDVLLHVSLVKFNLRNSLAEANQPQPSAH